VWRVGFQSGTLNAGKDGATVRMDFTTERTVCATRPKNDDVKVLDAEKEEEEEEEEELEDAIGAADRGNGGTAMMSRRRRFDASEVCAASASVSSSLSPSSPLRPAVMSFTVARERRPKTETATLDIFFFPLMYARAREKYSGT
jgi:hypothetical protein